MQAESLVEDLIEEEFEGLELRSYAEKQLFKHHQFEQLADAIEKRAKRRLWIGAAIALAAAALGITKLVLGPGLFIGVLFISWGVAFLAWCGHTFVVETTKMKTARRLFGRQKNEQKSNKRERVQSGTAWSRRTPGTCQSLTRAVLAACQV
jgi:hypothetical protein